RAGPRARDASGPSARSPRRRLLDVSDRAIRAVNLLGPRDRLLDAAGDLEAHVPRNRGIARRGDDHPPDVAQTLEGVDREDRVDGMKAQARAVGLEVVWPRRLVLP